MKLVLFKKKSIKLDYLVLFVFCAISVSIVVMVSDVIGLKYLLAAVFLLAGLTAIIFYSTVFAILSLLFIGFFGHQIIQFGAPLELIYVFDLILFLLFIKTIILRILSNDKFQLNGTIPIVLLIGVIVVSHFLNGNRIIQSLLFSRYLLSGYMIYFSILNIRIHEKQAKQILRFIIFIFLIQIPASLIKLLILGQGEQSVGAFGFSPGAFGTLVPLIAISFLFAFIIYNPVKRNLYFFLILCFIAVALIAEKRAFFFFMPITLLVDYLLCRIKVQKKIKIVILLLPLFLMAGYLYPKLNPTMNPQEKIWGDFSPKHIYEYVSYYVNSHDKYGNSCGRFATTKMTLENLITTKTFFLFGDGPGKLINSGIINAEMNISKFKYGIEDGITGFSWIAIQIGVLGFVFFMGFVLKLLKGVLTIYNNSSSIFLKIYGLGLMGMGFVFLIDICVYSKAILASRNLSPLFFILTAIYFKYGKCELSANYQVLKLTS